MSPYGISLLMLVAFAAFGYLVARKLAILRHLMPETRWDRPASRMKSVLVNGFLQRRMIQGERKPGAMHAAIFAGFMILLFRKLQLIAIGYDESAAYPGFAGGAFAGLKDVVELIVLVACGYALYRRLVLKPHRLERNREALAILSLIIAIMITDYAFDAFRFALRARPIPRLPTSAASRSSDPCWRPAWRRCLLLLWRRAITASTGCSSCSSFRFW